MSRKPDVQIVLTTNQPSEARPNNSVEVRADGLVLATTYGRDTAVEAYEEAIRYLTELLLAYRDQAMQ
jgi:hypothetical protein